MYKHYYKLVRLQKYYLIFKTKLKDLDKTSDSKADDYR